MKKVAVIITAAIFSLTACHYGKEEAATTLERNKEYKEKATEQGPEINPDYVKGGKPAANDTAKADSIAAPVAPAAPAH